MQKFLMIGFCATLYFILMIKNIVYESKIKQVKDSFIAFLPFFFICRTDTHHHVHIA